MRREDVDEPGSRSDTEDPHRQCFWHPLKTVLSSDGAVFAFLGHGVSFLLGSP
jgi:hypothetical protein